MRAPGGGGGFLPGRGVSGVGRFPTPDHLSLRRAARARYPLAMSAGDVGVGNRHEALSALSCELALRAVGAVRGRPGGGAPLAWVWGVQGRALSDARPPVLGACGRGLSPTGCGCGVCGRGDPSQTPQRALLRAGFARCGGGMRAPGGGGACCLGVGRLVLGAPPRLIAHPLGVRPGPAAHWLWVRGVWAGEPVTNPTARAHACWLCALWGQHEGAWEGGASCLGVRRPGLGALPRPTARPWGVRPGPLTHWLWVRGVWAWEPVTNPTARGLVCWLCALWGRHEGARGGGPFCLGLGRPVLGALPRPTARLWGVQLGLSPTGCGFGGVGVETCHVPHSARSCEVVLPAAGAARGRRWGGAACLGVGPPGLNAFPRPTARPWSVRPGLVTCLLWVRGLWAWGPVTNPTARALASWLCSLRGQH